MNERIKELLTPKLKEWGGASGDNFSEELEKFAELIVKECAKFTFKYTSDEKKIQEYNQVGWDCLSGDLRNAINEHFGVTE
jgi:hypothetical protein